ncbi:MAG: DNA repair protein RecO [Cytophagaceae bacterium]|jgi:DNA repair protein RecO (recombination protein O)|nr:DNA repair protein RecO [Cytophagaceae bacterium]
MLCKTHGIVLNHTRYGESNAIFHIFTRELGMQSYMVNGVFGKKKRDKALLLQPLCILELEVYHKDNKDIQRIKEFKLARHFERLPFVQERRAQLFFVAEILLRILRNENANHPLYDFITESILFLDSDCEGIENFHLFFLFKLTKYLGFYPNNAHAGKLAFFDFHDGNFAEHEPQHPYFIPPSEAQIFNRLFSCSNSTLKQLAVNVNERRILQKSLLALYDRHFAGLGKLRTVDVLPELF